MFGVAALAAAAVLMALSALLRLVSPTAAFFAIGALLLVGFLCLLSGSLGRSPYGESRARLTAARLAWRGIARNPLRSVLTAGLLAAASFVIVAVAANRRDPARLDALRRDSGSGGFNLMARCDVPLYRELGTPQGRAALGLAPEDEPAFEGTRIVSCPVLAGDDVSCLNLQRPRAPRVAGVPRELIEADGFSFTSTAGAAGWRLLERELPDGAVPAFADAASAQWIMKVGLGGELDVPAPDGGPVRLRIVGLLAPSIFAGEVLISQEQFLRRFGPDLGYRLFLIRTPAARREGVAQALRRGLGGMGLDVVRTGDVLADYARVQNTYLATFQTLGGLGLLMGTFGLVAVLLRGVLERRGELAMMLAVGLPPRTPALIIVLENALLLVLGLAIGAASALVGVAPHLVATASDVNWVSLAGTLFLCLAVGLAACAVAAWAAMRGELLPALRSE
jgi:hypothetical protein